MTVTINYTKILLIILLFFFSIHSYGNVFLSKQKKHISKLYKNNNYFETIRETERLLFFFKNDLSQQEKSWYNYLILINYYKGNQFNTLLKKIPEFAYADNYKFPVEILKAKTYEQKGFYEISEAILKDLTNFPITAQQKIELTWNKIKQKNDSCKYTEIIQLLEKENKTGNENFTKIYNEIKTGYPYKKKNKTIAVTFSAILPGTGQFYTNNYKDGLISFLSVTLVSSLTYIAFKKEKKALGYTGLFFSTLLYSGNIYSAYSSTNEYNIKSRDNFKHRINSYIPEYTPDLYLK